MKKLILASVLLIATAAVFAQSPIAPRGTQVNAGIGFSNWGVPVYIGLDFGVGRDVTLGGEFSYRSYQEKYHNENWDHTVMGISGNLNYHLNHALHLEKIWDPYVGLNVGYYIVNEDDNYNGDYHSQAGLGAQIGVRYYFTDTVGANLEFGGGNAFSGGKLGLSIKL